MSPRNEEQNKQIRDERREQILNAALRVFAQKGYSAAKISDIANVAGLSHGLVYHYFKSKDDVFVALVEFALDTSSATVTGALQSPGSPIEKLQALTEGMFVALFEYEETASYFLIMLQATTFDPVPEGVKKLLKEKGPIITQETIRVIVEGQQRGEIIADDPIALATTYWGLMQGMVLMSAGSNKSFPLPKVETIMRIFKA